MLYVLLRSHRGKMMEIPWDETCKLMVTLLSPNLEIENPTDNLTINGGVFHFIALRKSSNYSLIYIYILYIYI